MDKHTELSFKLQTIAIEAARSVRLLLLEGFTQGVTIEYKNDFHDLVTECDRRAEQQVSDYILEHHPDSTIVGEEGGRRGDGAVQWYVDPIDGTTNFATGYPFFCISIGAALADQMLAGVVFDPIRDELFTAHRSGVTLNGRPLHVRHCRRQSRAVLLTDFPSSHQNYELDQYKLLGHLVQCFQSVRRMGSTALMLAYVAAGRADVGLAVGISPWDVAAGYLLIQQAGGRYVPLKPAKFPWLSPGYIVCSPDFELEQSVLADLLPSAT